MLNPWVLLALTFFWISSVAGAFFGGKSFEAGQQAKAQQEAVKAALGDAAKAAEVDKQAAIAAAKKEGVAAGRAAALRGRGQDAIRSEPLAAACDWRPQSYSVLITAVRDANGAAPADTGLSDAVRKSNGADKPVR